MLTVTLGYLLSRGAILQPPEAVAIAQGLIDGSQGATSPENVELRSDGSVTSQTVDGPPSVRQIGVLLASLLELNPRVPAPLRYAIARSTGDVEAPPFESLEALSATLRRFEVGDRAEVVRGLLQRVARPAAQSARSEPVTQETVSPGPIATRPPAHTPSAVTAPVAWRGFEEVVIERTEVQSQPASHRRRRALAFAVALVSSALTGFVMTEAWARWTSPPEARQSQQPLPAVPPDRSADREPSSDAPVATAGRDDPIASHALPSSSVPASSTPTGIDAAKVREAVPLTAASTVPPVRALPTDATEEFSPSFSATGTAMFFHTGGPRASSSAIAMASPAGSLADDLQVMTIVDDGARNYHPQPSPDGRLVAFDSDRDGERGVYVANRDGSNVHRVSGSGYAAVPTWAPDASGLAYIRAEPDRPAVWNLWMKPENGEERRITRYSYGQTWGASWFPDSRRVCYSHEDTLNVIDLTTGEFRRFASPVKGSLVRTPAVSPDGSRIIFQVFHHGAWMLNLDDGAMLPVLTDPTAEEFAWAPDGTRVAFHSRRDGRWAVYQLLGK